MRKLLIYAFLAFAVFKGYEQYNASSVEPLYAGPYVAVYGRNTCSFTKNMRKDLAAKGISARYFIVDDKRVADELHKRMTASGISTRRYNLPVVDVSGKLYVRPTLEKVLAEYRK